MCGREQVSKVSDAHITGYCYVGVLENQRVELSVALQEHPHSGNMPAPYQRYICLPPSPFLHSFVALMCCIIRSESTGMGGCGSTCPDSTPGVTVLLRFCMRNHCWNGRHFLGWEGGGCFFAWRRKEWLLLYNIHMSWIGVVCFVVNGWDQVVHWKWHRAVTYAFTVLAHFLCETTLTSLQSIYP